MRCQATVSSTRYATSRKSSSIISFLWPSMFSLESCNQCHQTTQFCSISLVVPYTMMMASVFSPSWLRVEVRREASVSPFTLYFYWDLWNNPLPIPSIDKLFVSIFPGIMYASDISWPSLLPTIWKFQGLPNKKICMGERSQFCVSG